MCLEQNLTSTLTVSKEKLRFMKETRNLCNMGACYIFAVVHTTAAQCLAQTEPALCADIQREGQKNQWSIK